MTDRRKKIASAVYQTMDSEGRGYVTLADIANLCRPERFDKVKFGKQTPAQFIDNLLSMIDKDHQGRVSVEQWMAFCNDLRYS